MGKAQVQRVGRRTDGQTDMPISIQEQKKKKRQTQRNLHLSAACAKAEGRILFGYFCGSVGDENLMFGLSII